MRRFGRHATMEKKWWTLLVVCAGTFMLLLDVSIVIVALPSIETSLHATFAQVQWVLDAYALTLASLLLTGGVLADRYGRRLLFAIGLTVFTLGSLTCGLAQSPAMLVVSRCGQGVGGAIVFATSLALLGHSFRGKDRGIAFAAWGAITGLAVSLGPILGGALTSGISWRAIFLINVPVGICAVGLTFLRVEESRAARPGRPDWAGFLLLTAGLVAFVYGLIRASETNWGNRVVVATLAAGVALLVGFVIVELRGREPMFDLGLFRTPTFTGGLIAAFTMNGSLFAFFLYLVLYLQDILHYSAFQTGLRLLVLTGAMLVAAVASGRLSEHVPVRLLIGPGLFLVAVGLALMGGLSTTSTWTHLLPGLIVAGVGAGLVNPPLASTAIGVVEPERAGMASGVNSTFRQIGFAMSIAALGTIFLTVFRDRLTGVLAARPALAARAGAITSDFRHGGAARALASAPPADRARLGLALRSAFSSGIDDLVLVTGGLALVGALGSLALIRSRDFVAREGRSPEAAGSEHDRFATVSTLPVREAARRLRKERIWMRSLRMTGLLVVCVSVWGGMVTLAGPTFTFETRGTPEAWVFSENHLTLGIAAGLAGIAGGLLMLVAGRRLFRLGALLALLGGIWFVVSPSLEPLWDAAGHGLPGSIGATGSTTVRALESIGFFYGTGALLVLLASMAFGASFIAAPAPAADEQGTETVVVPAQPRRVEPISAEPVARS